MSGIISLFPIKTETYINHQYKNFASGENHQAVQARYVCFGAEQ